MTSRANQELRPSSINAKYKSDWANKMAAGCKSLEEFMDEVEALLEREKPRKS